ncbi:MULTISPECIES: CRISPR-associated helicase/endonuclease Cas3 [Acetobacter]|uniref:CRISPR-associated helicase/endonuclease Cas3 n=2 Tax=Acetobacter TaxID=434 RepID=A0AAN1PHD7_9PROT|nr:MULTISPECIES: CRISPR-associated helicase/endonuclease Cas3 [Acetobacter]ASL40497.1 CRISPR-associated helicase/endonuclease Cas3 [Acetobacter oryzifermentans]AXN00162.1 CRISPR-associated helicase/endonuclease Cas3 [Acetobacter pomorum]KAA8395365.1 CRISPR-associated helicase/endonuclease Cas3 [Acetobacter sp. DmW_125128]KAA8400095.1 CRISPR-associated helicase/endonuclease Cas3 [Acetobacter sp. DmW_125127]KAA8400203.1 CRISPR-associated helicase/endonuclease Cas3 [Acetobacter sp. DmW_125124]
MPDTQEGKGLKFFWGKARPASVGLGEDSSIHPLIAHMLDVAAVAILLPGSQRLGLDNRQLGMLVALHDIGKLTPAFQAKVPECWPEQALGECPDEVVASRHDVDGVLFLDRICREELAPLFGTDSEGEGWLLSDKRRLWRAVAGHHGQPVSVNDYQTRASDIKLSAPYAHKLVSLLFDVFRPPPIKPYHSLDHLLQLEWQLAGLTVQADWIGSRQEWFPYVRPDDVDDLSGYFWNKALPRAQSAIVHAGLAPASISPFQGIAHLFPHIRTPSPVQALLDVTSLPAGPTLVVIEDMTGSGKTEAALVAAHRLMASGRASGLFVALPTMATANAMFDRLATAYRNLFQPSSHPSLALAHGRALLDERFVSVLAPDDVLDGAELKKDRDQAAEICCSAWLGREARRALLAQVGVGTIDQALMAVLPVRFATVRQAGLAGKVLLVDECHAYDPYMQEEMVALLRFHAAMGGSAILLSATLTKAVRQKLTDAFREGLRQEKSVSLSCMAYPLVTVVGKAEVEELPCAPRPGLERSITVRQVREEAAVMAEVSLAAAKGAAVAWVRNTVDDVIASAKALKEQGIEIMVFHARFAMVDRLAIERAVLARFGKNGTATERAAVLIASQVIEQSLDLDFDVLCTDLAPMDLIIQRAGRLRRHTRKQRPVDCDEIYIFSPDPVANPDPKWISRLLPGTAAVYRDHALLWRTAKVLQRKGKIQSPDAIRELIEEAGNVSDVPDGLMAASDEAEGKGRAARGEAMRNVLDYEAGYAPDSALWEREVRTSTRLEERPYVTVRLGIMKDGQVCPWAALQDVALAVPHERKRAWALSEVSAARHVLAACPVVGSQQEAVSAARAEWPRWERDAEDQFLLLLLEEAEEGWRGVGRNEAEQDVVVCYDKKYGFQILKETLT